MESISTMYVSDLHLLLVADLGSYLQIQFYNQGQIYIDCTSLIFTSGGSFPSTSVFEINSYSSVPLSKIVIGKPLDESGAANGYMTADTLNACVKQATLKGWNGGVMYWEWQKSLASLAMLAVIA
jgi:chitinase